MFQAVSQHQAVGMSCVLHRLVVADALAGHVFHLTSCSVGLYVLELRYVLLVGADTGAHVGNL